jgi:hypothetical protein
VSHRFLRAAWLLIGAAALSAACARLDQRLDQHRQKLESLGASTMAIGEAWLGGSVSGTYACTALEEIYRLVERERTSLAASPQSLLDPRGARLSQAAERLSRLLAVMLQAVREADAASLRRHLSAVPILPREQR